MTPLRNQLFVRIATVVRRDDQTALALGLFTERDGAADFRQDRRLFRTTSFEQVGNARQTTGDVASLRGLLRDTRDNVTNTHLRTVVQVDQGVSRQEVLCRYIGTWQQQILACSIDQLHGRTDVLAGSRTVLRIHHFDVGQTGEFVSLALDGDVLFHAGEGNGTVHLGHDRVGVRVPLGDDGARIDLVTFLHGDDRTVRQLVALALTTEVVSHRQLTGTRHRDQRAVGTLYMLQVVQANGTAVLDLYVIHSRGPASRTTDVEGTHGQLGTRLTDRLGSDNADSLTDVYTVTTSQIAAVAHGADTMTGFAADRRTHNDFVDAHLLKEIDPLLVDQGACGHDHIVATRLEHVTRDYATQDALTQRLYHVAAFDVRGHHQTMLGAAVDFSHHQVLSNVDEATSQVTGVRSLQCGIRQTFTSTESGDEVLEYVQAFTEVRGDRGLDDGAVRLGHQATHAGQLTDLGRRAPRTGVRHHVHGVEGLLVDFLALAIGHLLFREVGHHRFGHFVVGLRPQVDHFVVLLALGYQAGGVLTLDLFHFISGSVDDASFFVRDDEIVHADRNAGDGRVGEAGVHQLVREDNGILQTDHAIAVVDQLGDGLLLHRLVDHVEGQASWDNLEQQRTADGGVDDAGVGRQGAVFVLDLLVDAHFYAGVQGHLAAAVCAVNFLQVCERHALALGVDRFTGHVVQTQHHVLRRHDDRLAVGGRQDVVGRHHQHARFQLSLEGQRNVHGHLVTVEVGVVRGADQRVQLNRLTFDQHRLERLDAQTVQGRRTVQQYGVFADDLGENVPHLRQLTLDHLLGGLDGGGHTTTFQLAEDERFEQLESHFLRQTALVQTQGWTYGDYRTARVVHALAEQVLTETTLLTLDHVGQGLQRALVRTGDGTATTTVVQQGIDGFLQHALFVAHDDVRSSQI
ncbi:MAG: hypothetical protein GAK45_01131 [Pseudomonas citronellolis]|nr:MAG: hypothetical protein GAK45_01131 [Pseudomonas citronellolis]